MRWLWRAAVTAWCRCTGRSPATAGSPARAASRNARHRPSTLTAAARRTACVGDSTDTDIIKGWFGCQALDANLGVVTDKLIALDIDPRHDGDESLRELEQRAWRIADDLARDHRRRRRARHLCLPGGLQRRLDAGAG